MLNKQDEPGTLRLLVVFLRFYAHMTQTELGKAASVEQALVSRYESGQQPPPDEVAATDGEGDGHPLAAGDAPAPPLLGGHPVERPARGAMTDFAAGSLGRLLDRVLVATGPVPGREVTSNAGLGTASRADAPRGGGGLGESPGSPHGPAAAAARASPSTPAKSWALAERLCDASLEALADPRECPRSGGPGAVHRPGSGGGGRLALAGEGVLLGPRRPCPAGGQDAAGARRRRRGPGELWEAGELRRWRASFGGADVRAPGGRRPSRERRARPVVSPSALSFENGMPLELTPG